MNRGYVIKLALVWVAIFIALAVAFWLLQFDFSFMLHWAGFMAQGIGYTVLVSAISILFAVILALIGALARLSKNPIANGLSAFYISFIRGTPLLVQVYMVYLGLPQVGQSLEALGAPEWLADAFVLSAVPSGVLALSVNYGAYMTETFRAGIQSIHPGQREAALSLGMTPAQCMRRIILPQALRVVIPPVGNDFIAMLKDSSLISVVALPEILQQGRLWVSRTFRAFEGYNTVALFYLVMTLVLSLLVRFIERKSALPGR